MKELYLGAGLDLFSSYADGIVDAAYEVRDYFVGLGGALAAILGGVFFGKKKEM